MLRLRRRHLWFVLGFLVFGVSDMALTLYGQPDAYWRGDRGAANELNPVAWQFLALDPLAFVVVGLLWVAGCSLALLALPARLAWSCGLLLQFGHTLGVATWVCLLTGRFLLAAAVFVASAALAEWVRRRTDAAVRRSTE
jgi:hypothetical protein